MGWDHLAAAVTGRRSWLLAVGAALLGVGFMVLIGGNAAAGQAPLSAPAESQSAQVDALARQFPGGDRAPLIVVVSRTDGAILDTFVVRTLVIPALFALIGDRIWWPAQPSRTKDAETHWPQQERSTP